MADSGCAYFPLAGPGHETRLEYWPGFRVALDGLGDLFSLLGEYDTMGEVVEGMLLVARDADDRPWLRAAACRGRDQSRAFYPPMHHESRDERAQREQLAKTICMGCPVQAACRDYALGIREPFGIWGGLTEYERRALLTAAAS